MIPVWGMQNNTEETVHSYEELVTTHRDSKDISLESMREISPLWFGVCLNKDEKGEENNREIPQLEVRKSVSYNDEGNKASAFRLLEYSDVIYRGDPSPLPKNHVYDSLKSDPGLFNSYCHKQTNKRRGGQKCVIYGRISLQIPSSLLKLASM